MGKKGGNKKGGGAGPVGGAADPGYAKTKAGKKELAAKKKQAKLAIACGLDLLEEALAAQEANSCAVAESKLSEARAEFQAVSDSYGGVHLEALYNLGVVSQTRVEWNSSAGTGDANSISAGLIDAADFFKRAIEADTSKRGVTAGLAHAGLASVILDPRRKKGKPTTSTQLENALKHLNRAKEIHADATGGSVESITMLQIGDCHAGLMEHYLTNEDEPAMLAKEQLCLACNAYGFEGELASVANTSEHGLDFDLLLQKLRAIHRFVSWTLDDYPSESIPAGISESDLLGFIAQAKACCKALVALADLDDSGCGGHGDGGKSNIAASVDEKLAMLKLQIGRSESAARARARNTLGSANAVGGEIQEEVACELLMMSGDIYDFAALLDEENALELRLEAITALRIAAMLCPKDPDVQSSLGEQLFEIGKLQDDGIKEKSLMKAAEMYEKALALTAPNMDAVSTYNLLCIRILLHKSYTSSDSQGDGDDDASSVEKLNKLLETAAIAAVADEDSDFENKEDAIAGLKQELREDDDLKSFVTLPFFVHLVGSDG